MELKDVINENWKVIKGFESRYLISNKGEVFSVYSNKLLDINTNTKGRPFVILSDRSKGNTKTMEIHRLVAENWIPIPSPEYIQVNHKDEDVFNNHVDNLEWCTPKYNANYGTRNFRTAEKVRKYITQCDHKGKPYFIFKGVKEAGKYYDTDFSKISKCLTGRNSLSLGCKWRYSTIEEIRLFDEEREINSELVRLKIKR